MADVSPADRVKAEALIGLYARMAAADRWLPVILRGEALPADPHRATEFAWLCRQPYREMYAASARFYRARLRGRCEAGPSLSF